MANHDGFCFIDLRKHVEQIVTEWRDLANKWEAEDRKNFVEHSALGKVQPHLFMMSERVMVLRQCTDVLRHTLEAYRG